MPINISRLNLSERDIEDWLYENPKSVSLQNGIFVVERWIARQCKLPSGIADLVGWTESGHVVVVEIKNVMADGRALAQVCRYAHDVKHVVERHWDYKWMNNNGAFIVKAVIAPSFDPTAFYEAEALDIHLHLFSVSLHIDVNRASRPNEFNIDSADNYWDAIHSVSQGDEWSVLGPFISVHEERRYQKDWEQRNKHREFQGEMTCDGGDAEHF